MSKKSPTRGQRSRNVYGHEAMDLKAREELIRRGVKPDTPNMPSADYTHEGNERTLREGAKVRRHRIKLTAADLKRYAKEY